MEQVELGARIRQLRTSARMSASELAHKAQLEMTVLSKIEHGRRAIKSSELGRLAEGLGISVLGILEPESVLGRLVEQAGGRGEGGRFLTWLIEIDEVLRDAGIFSKKGTLLADVEAAKKGKTAGELGRWCRERVTMGLVGPTSRLEGLCELAEAGLGIDVVVSQRVNESAAVVSPEFSAVVIGASNAGESSLFELGCFTGAIILGERDTHWVSRRDLSNPEVLEFARELLMSEEDLAGCYRVGESALKAMGRMIVGCEVDLKSLVERVEGAGIFTTEELAEIVIGGLTGVLGAADEDQMVGAILTICATRVARVPLRYLARAVRGYELGAISARALAGLLETDSERLLEKLSPQRRTGVKHSEAHSLAQ